MSSAPGDELHELAERQDPRLLRALDVVAPGAALREGLDNIVHASTGGLIVVGDPGDISHLLSGGIRLDIDYTPAMLYQVAKMDGAIVLNAEATKIVWANVQLMPDPTILSSETGTRHRTAERVSKQTKALVVAISQRRDVVSLYVEGTKYILQEIPAVLAKANQGLATLEKYRERLEHVSNRLTVLEFEGGGVLYDALTALQRAELTTRMAVEVERYIVELGTEGRLIEMQLEETMVGVAADKTALIRDYLVEDTEQNLATALQSLARMPHEDVLDFGRLAELLGYDRKLNTLDFPVAPRGYRIMGRIPRIPKLVVQKIIRELGGSGGGPGGLRRRPGGGRGRRADEGQGHPRGPAQAPGGRLGRQVLTELTVSRGRRAIERSRAIPQLEEATEVSVEEVEYVCDFEEGDKVVYPHHGAGLVMKKEARELMGEERDYLTIKILHNELTVMVPCENAGKAGLRRVIDEEEIKKVTSVLTDEVSEMPKNWNRRFKYNREKIKTGDVFELAEVVRNLAIREMEKGLSTGEKQMYTRAKKILASEFMYALDKDEEGAEEYLDGLLEERFAATA